MFSGWLLRCSANSTRPSDFDSTEVSAGEARWLQLKPHLGVGLWGGFSSWNLPGRHWLFGRQEATIAHQSC